MLGKTINYGCRKFLHSLAQLIRPSALSYAGHFSGLCDQQDTFGNAVAPLWPLKDSRLALSCEFP